MCVLLDGIQYVCIEVAVMPLLVRGAALCIPPLGVCLQRQQLVQWNVSLSL